MISNKIRIITHDICPAVQAMIDKLSGARIQFRVISTCSGVVEDRVEALAEMDWFDVNNDDLPMVVIRTSPQGCQAFHGDAFREGGLDAIDRAVHQGVS